MEPSVSLLHFFFEREPVRCSMDNVATIIVKVPCLFVDANNVDESIVEAPSMTVDEAVQNAMIIAKKVEESRVRYSFIN